MHMTLSGTFEKHRALSSFHVQDQMYQHPTDWMCPYTWNTKAVEGSTRRYILTPACTDVADVRLCAVVRTSLACPELSRGLRVCLLL